MKFLIAFFVPAMAFASLAGLDLKLRQSVADNIQALLDDTVNEGFGSAEVLEGQDGPAVECKISENNQEPGKKWAYCTVQFEVHWDEDSTIRSCGLLYSFTPGQISTSLKRGPDHFFDDCTESLSESID